MRLNDSSYMYELEKKTMTKRTLRGSKLKKVRTSGFRARLKTSAGKKVLKARRQRKRKLLSMS